MLELLDQSAPAFTAVVFAFTLLIGSFLNVVIHRLPIMMEREWREQAKELSETPPESELPEVVLISSYRALAAHPAAT